MTLEDLNRMKPTSLLVNTSRAELVEHDALIAGLNRGRPGMAAVDVFESEPILQGHALLRLENCICTPHIGYVELDSYEMYFGAAFDNVVNFIKGTPTNLVNPGALAGPALRDGLNPGARHRRSRHPSEPLVDRRRHAPRRCPRARPACCGRCCSAISSSAPASWWCPAP